MKAVISALASGLLFGIGLGISGMTLPSKVLGFLRLDSDWDPSLALVMVGAIAVHALTSRLVFRRDGPLWGESFRLPTKADITPSLLVGSAVFGVGWGIGGLCPGPGLVSLGGFTTTGLLFTSALIVGMRTYDVAAKALSTPEKALTRAPSQ